MASRIMEVGARAVPTGHTAGSAPFASGSRLLHLLMTTGRPHGWPAVSGTAGVHHIQQLDDNLPPLSDPARPPGFSVGSNCGSSTARKASLGAMERLGEACRLPRPVHTRSQTTTAARAPAV